VVKNVTAFDGVEALSQSIMATPKRQRRLLSKTFWGKLGIRRRTKKHVEEVTGALRQRGLTLHLEDAEFGTESKNAWLSTEPRRAVVKSGGHADGRSRVGAARSYYTLPDVN
jgi:hypothetical protein